jgi:hypothetical protein
MQAKPMNSNSGYSDKVVNNSDKAQILDDSSLIIFLSVGRLLLDKNSLPYT